MSEKQKKIVENFCERFLQTDESLETFREVLRSPPGILKDCSEEDAKKLEDNKITRIGDMRRIKFRKIPKLAEKIGVDEHDLRKWVMAAGLVARAWKKRSSYLSKSEMKIAVLGLDNAGKSSMLRSLSGKTNLGEIVDLEPTVGVDIKKIESENYNLVIWDFGGQVGHRHDYLESPEQFFVQVDSLFFVVDIQDSDRYDEAFEYFKQILDIILFLNEIPYVLILLHKVDPDIKDDPDFEINIEFVRGKFEQRLMDEDLPYDIVETSIYNFYAKEPEFAKTFKQFFVKGSKPQTLEESIASLSQTMMNLSTSMIRNFNEIKALLRNMGQQSLQAPAPSDDGSIPAPAAGSVKTSAATSMMSTEGSSSDASHDLQKPPKPPEPPKSPKKGTGRGGSRAELMSELRNVLKIRRLMSE